jgi:hypothetical protein
MYEQIVVFIVVHSIVCNSMQANASRGVPTKMKANETKGNSSPFYIQRLRSNLHNSLKGDHALWLSTNKPNMN